MSKLWNKERRASRRGLWIARTNAQILTRNGASVNFAGGTINEVMLHFSLNDPVATVRILA